MSNKKYYGGYENECMLQTNMVYCNGSQYNSFIDLPDYINGLGQTWKNIGGILTGMYINYDATSICDTVFGKYGELILVPRQTIVNKGIMYMKKEIHSVILHKSGPRMIFEDHGMYVSLNDILRYVNGYIDNIKGCNTIPNSIGNDRSDRYMFTDEKNVELRSAAMSDAKDYIDSMEGTDVYRKHEINISDKYGNSNASIKTRLTNEVTNNIMNGKYEDKFRIRQKGLSDNQLSNLKHSYYRDENGDIQVIY